LWSGPGQQAGSIASPALVSSLLDIYLGADPVSKVRRQGL
jgi:hypothetical protein